MKIIDNYKKFIKKIEDSYLLRKYGIKNYTRNSDGSINVIGDVDAYGEDISKISINIRSVSGDFKFSNNILSTLKVLVVISIVLIMN